MIVHKIDMQMALKPIKKCSSSPIIVMQIKTTLTRHFSPITLAEIPKLNKPTL